MGEALGTQYAELWQELAQLHIVWLEFVELYGTEKKPHRTYESCGSQLLPNDPGQSL